MSIPSLSLADKVAVVTGAKRGIGKAIALGFAEAGADVVVGTRMVADGKLEATAEEIRKLGRHSLAIQVDISRKTDVDNMVQKVMNEFGVIDILVNNAGILTGALMLESQEDDWDRVIDTNLKGYYLCCQAVGKRMIEQKGGNIINIASLAGVRPHPGRGVYCISKAGVVMLTEVLALELASYNVRVNSIAPYMVKTSMLEPWVADPEIRKRNEASIPLGRLSELSDVVGAALFLASDASSFITGHLLWVDGGYRLAEPFQK